MCQPMEEPNSVDSFTYNSFLTNEIHVNRSSNSFINNFDESLFDSLSEKQNDTVKYSGNFI